LILFIFHIFGCKLNPLRILLKTLFFHQFFPVICSRLRILVIEL
jgi:hypothetical protein